MPFYGGWLLMLTEKQYYITQGRNIFITEDEVVKYNFLNKKWGDIFHV